MDQKNKKRKIINTGDKKEFLKSPNLEEEGDRIKRKEIDYEPTHQQFFKNEENIFNNQYFSIYSTRYNEMRPILEQVINKKKKGKANISRLLQLKSGETSIVIGTLYKNMPLMPTILDEYAADRGLKSLQQKERYVSDNDTIIIEDESGRAQLVGKIDKNKLVTGVVVGLEGKELDTGEFEVENVFYPEMAPQIELKYKDVKEEKYVAIVSGLHIGDEKVDERYYDLLIDFLGGYLGGKEDHSLQSKITRLIIAGNSIFSEKRNEELLKLKTYNQTINQQSKLNINQPIKQFDLILSQLCSNLHVDIMPGDKDPAIKLFPQQPFNPTLIPLSIKYPKTCSPVTNPYSLQSEQTLFIGSSGQNISNLKSFTKSDNEEEETMDLMCDTLRWRNIAPTCPNTLPGFPFSSTDPFLVKNTPHVYFVGNQTSFAQKFENGSDGQVVSIVSVPVFASSHTIVLVNIHSLEAHPITFHLDK